METRRYLDTNILVFLFTGNENYISKNVLYSVENYIVYFSPIVRLELTYLFESKKINYTADKIITELGKTFDLKECDLHFSNVIDETIKIKWTRDPFDRIIVAQAALGNNILLTKDRIVLDNYKHAVW